MVFERSFMEAMANTPPLYEDANFTHQRGTHRVVWIQRDQYTKTTFRVTFAVTHGDTTYKPDRTVDPRKDEVKIIPCDSPTIEIGEFGNPVLFLNQEQYDELLRYDVLALRE